MINSSLKLNTRGPNNSPKTVSEAIWESENHCDSHYSFFSQIKQSELPNSLTWHICMYCKHILREPDYGLQWNWSIVLFEVVQKIADIDVWSDWRVHSAWVTLDITKKSIQTICTLSSAHWSIKLLDRKEYWDCSLHTMPMETCPKTTIEWSNREILALPQA